MDIRQWRSVLLVALSAASLPLAAAQAAPAAFQWQLPRGFPVPFVPADNPMSVAKVRAGPAPVL